MRKRKDTDAIVSAALTAWASWLLTWAQSEGSMHTVGELWEGRMRVVGKVPGSPVLADVIAAEAMQTAWPEALHRGICDMDRNLRFGLLALALEISQERLADELRVPRKRIGILQREALLQFGIIVRITIRNRGGSLARQDAALVDQQRRAERENRRAAA